MPLEQQRHGIRRMLNVSDPADALLVYYALHHDPARSVLVTETDATGRVTDFVGRFQTGLDLFRPLVIMQCQDAERAAHLMAQVLTPGRSYMLFAASRQRPLVGGSLELISVRALKVFAFLTGTIQPVINILLQRRSAPDGSPYFVIESGDQRAVSGLNWRSPTFAEIYVHTDAPARRQGWGKSVAAAMSQSVLESGRIPLYLVEETSDVSLRLAESLGYVDTGARQLYADCVYLGSPNE